MGGFPAVAVVNGSPIGKLLHSGETQFSMQWVLPTVHDYDWSESASEYEARTGKMPYEHVGLPGVSIPDIAESFAEYLALREVEDWAGANLSSRSE
jgi:hypothetical protein